MTTLGYQCQRGGSRIRGPEPAVTVLGLSSGVAEWSRKRTDRRNRRPGPMTGEDIYGSPEHQQLRAVVRKFVQAELVPRAREFDEVGRPDKAIFRRLRELGLLGVPHGPEDR